MAYNGEYQGCSIAIRIDACSDGKLRATSEITAVSSGAIATFRRYGIDRLITVTIVEAADEEELVELAKCEIDFVFESSF